MTAVAFYFHRLGQASSAECMIYQGSEDLSWRGREVHLLCLDGPGTASFYPIGRAVMSTPVSRTF